MSRPDETLQRVRRIETRLTQLMVAMGVDTMSQKPKFGIYDIPGEDREVAAINLPSPHSSLKEALDIIPATWEGPVRVFVNDELVAVLDRPGNRL